MREGGVDYGLVYPKIIQTSPEMYVVQMEQDTIKISEVIESNKELQYYLGSDKIDISMDKKIELLNMSCAAYTIISYVFGGFYRDAGSLILTQTVFTCTNQVIWSCETLTISQVSAGDSLSRLTRLPKTISSVPTISQLSLDWTADSQSSMTGCGKE